MAKPFRLDIFLKYTIYMPKRKAANLKNNFKIFYIYIITDTEVYTTKHVTINKG
jgi:hypothetical protein